MNEPTVMLLESNELADDDITRQQWVGRQSCNSIEMSGPTIVFPVTNGWADSQATL
jgi:hypothetical protein